MIDKRRAEPGPIRTEDDDPSLYFEGFQRLEDPNGEGQAAKIQ
jgi:hypothetical protein